MTVPVIASLNGTTPESWIEYARLIEQAGAHALEINVYYLATDPQENGEDVETRTLQTAASRQGRRLHPGRRQALALLLLVLESGAASSKGPAPTGS